MMNIASVTAAVILMAIYIQAQIEFPQSAYQTFADGQQSGNSDDCPLHNAVKRIEWDEKRHFCGSYLANAVRDICRGYYNPDGYRYRRGDNGPTKRHIMEKKRTGIADECCKVCCTPRYIKEFYCADHGYDNRPFVYVHGVGEPYNSQNNANIPLSTERPTDSSTKKTIPQTPALKPSIITDYYNSYMQTALNMVLLLNSTTHSDEPASVGLVTVESDIVELTTIRSTTVDPATVIRVFNDTSDDPHLMENFNYTISI